MPINLLAIYIHILHYHFPRIQTKTESIFRHYRHLRVKCQLSSGDTRKTVLFHENIFRIFSRKNANHMAIVKPSRSYIRCFTYAGGRYKFYRDM